MSDQGTKKSGSVLEKTGSVLVVGAGIAGVQASLDLADMGYYVHLVEKSPAIGGRMAQLDKTFPTNDCSMCIISPKLNDCGGHINIEIHTGSELLDVSGEPGNLKAKVLQKARYIDIDKCTSCDDCAQACPVELSNKFNSALDNQRAAYKTYPQAFPNAYAIDKLDLSPCTSTCPAGVNAHGYVSLVKEARYEEAMQVIMEVLPLPGTLGRVCFQPCEDQCRRAQVDSPVAIRELKRLAADKADILDIEIPLAEEKAEKVAIIGAGPAGLSAGYHLAKMGYKSTIFEALPVPGGMLRVGVPDYRLPPEVLNKEIEAITRLGVEIKYNTPLGPDLTIDDIKAQGYKAVFLGLGSHKSRNLGIDGEDAGGVHMAAAFLKQAALGPAPTVGKKVLVIGGGDVAIDSARTAVRLGAEEVRIAYRRSRQEMPCREEEIVQAEEEGIELFLLAGPLRFMTDDSGNVQAMEYQQNKLGEPDESGRRSPVSDGSDPKQIEADTVVVAIGQMTDLSALEGIAGITATRSGDLSVDPVTYETGIDGVFAAGDMYTGPLSAIAAVGGGMEAATSIDRYIRGEDLAEGRTVRDHNLDGKTWADIDPDTLVKERLTMPRIPIDQRTAGNDEIDLGFVEDEGREEADRCLSCSLCCDCHRCVEACGPEAVTLETHAMTDEVIELNVGSVIVSAGFDPFDPTRFENYQYSASPNVVTALEFERILSASGPYQGHMIRPSDDKEPKKMAWMQCVGSRDINKCDRPYCSSVCCMFAIKEAIIAKEHSGGDLDATIFFMDMRTHGKDFDKYLERAKEAGIKFVRCRIHSVNRTENEDLILRYADEDGSVKTEQFDMVVLSTGMEPSAGFNELAKRLDLDLNNEGFIEAGSFEPVSTSRPGIFACGAINEPKDIPFSVMEASAAASAASAGLAGSRFTETKILEYPLEKDVSDQAPRIGVFVCHCGINIAGVVDVPTTAELARDLPFVEFSTDNLFTCSSDTQVKIKEAIIENNLNRVVIASCSPRTHEPMFRETIQQAGLNKYLFEMANIRDQDSWVHRDTPELATKKAQDLIRAAVAKVALLEPLSQTEMGLTKEALVIGGGVAGMTSAMGLSEQGFPVHLIEKSDQLGGNALNLNSTWRGEDIKAYTESLIEKITADENITIYFESEVKKCDGFLGNFDTTIITGADEKVIPHGVVIVATGGAAHTPTEYLYETHDRVVTSLEMDALLAQKSKIVKKAGAAVFIQCVGSREPDRPYCSKVCCTHSVENAIKIKETNRKAAVYVLYRELRTYGYRETLYRKARELGVIFIRYDVDEKPLVEESGPEQVKVTVKDLILGLPIEIDCDILCLASAIIPNDGGHVGEAYKVSRNAEGFFLEAHMKLRPVDFANEGMFLAGLAHYPKPIEESIAQARAAAARATTVLAQEKIKVGGVVAVVESKKCAACLTCVRTCPFDVPKIGPDGHAIIEPAICQGCGACVSECPGKAISLQHFTDEQLLAKTRALIA